MEELDASEFSELMAEVEIDPDEKAKEATLEPSQSATVDAAAVQDEDEDESNDADENDLAAAGAKVGLKIIKRRTSQVRCCKSS